MYNDVVRLKNGSLQLLRYTNVVLAVNEGNIQPFVTWVIDQDNDCHLGHYYIDLNSALEDFKTRVSNK